MTDIDIDAIRQREQAATEGPWTTGADKAWSDVFPPWALVINANHPLIEMQTGAQGVADAEFIVAARADVPALLAKVDELTAERDLNGDLLDGTARALGIDLEDPDVHYAFNIPTKVAELVAALTQSRAQAATYANEIGTLKAHNSRLRTKLAERGLPDDADHWVNFNGVCEDDCPECAALKATRAEATR